MIYTNVILKFDGAHPSHDGLRLNLYNKSHRLKSTRTFLLLLNVKCPICNLFNFYEPHFQYFLNLNAQPFYDNIILLIHYYAMAISLTS